MIASSQFSNLQLGNLARNAELTFNFGNFQNWELSILATFNFGNFQFNSSKLLIYVQILATFNFGNFQFNSAKIHTNF